MSRAASSEEQRKRLDLRVDEASMLSFPASDPPAVFVEEQQPTPEETVRAPVSLGQEDADETSFHDRQRRRRLGDG
jgi:hypothetical protein